MKKAINKKGYTLVEIMCSVAIILILLGVFSSAMIDAYNRSKTDIIVVGSQQKANLDVVEHVFNGSPIDNSSLSGTTVGQGVYAPNSASGGTNSGSSNDTTVAGGNQGGSGAAVNVDNSSAPQEETVNNPGTTPNGNEAILEEDIAEAEIEDVTAALEQFRVIHRPSEGRYMNRLYEQTTNTRYFKTNKAPDGSNYYCWAIGNDAVTVTANQEYRCLSFAQGSRTTVYEEFEARLFAQGYSDFHIDYIVFGNEITRADSVDAGAGEFDGGSINVVGYQITTSDGEVVTLEGSGYSMFQESRTHSYRIY